MQIDPNALTGHSLLEPDGASCTITRHNAADAPHRPSDPETIESTAADGRPGPGSSPVPVSFGASRRAGWAPARTPRRPGLPAHRAGHLDRFGLRPSPRTFGASTHEGARP